MHSNAIFRFVDIGKESLLGGGVEYCPMLFRGKNVKRGQ
jgi:hypothetical protein